jgi:hypothetical protein
MGITCRTGEVLNGEQKSFAGKSAASMLIVIVKAILVTGRGGS